MVPHRRRSRTLDSLTAILLAVTTLIVFSGGALWHGADDDACEGVTVVHDASAHVITSATGPAAPVEAQHCALCHWVRSPRPVVTVLVEAVPDVTARPVALRHPERLIPALLAARLPARAPPA